MIRRGRGQEVSCNSRTHHTRPREGREDELMKCRKSAGANCYAVETRRPPGHFVCGYLGGAAATTTAHPQSSAPNQQSRLNRSCSFHPLFHSNSRSTHRFAIHHRSRRFWCFVSIVPALALLKNVATYGKSGCRAVELSSLRDGLVPKHLTKQQRNKCLIGQPSSPSAG